MTESVGVSDGVADSVGVGVSVVGASVGVADSVGVGVPDGAGDSDGDGLAVSVGVLAVGWPEASL
jgi:hypothetical protein